jgi:hypothetical protein
MSNAGVAQGVLANMVWTTREQLLQCATVAARYRAIKEYARQSRRQLVLHDFAECTKDEYDL